MAHALDQDVEHGRRVLGARQIDRLLTQAAVKRADELAIHKHGGVVVQVGDEQFSALAADQRGPVEHQALVLAVHLERPGLHRLHGRWKVVPDGGVRLHRECGHLDGRNRIGHGRKRRRGAAVRPDEVAQRLILGRHAALLVDGGVIVVTGDVRLVALAA